MRTWLSVMGRRAVPENGEVWKMGVVVPRSSVGDEYRVEVLLARVVVPLRVRARKACSAPTEGIGGISKGSNKMSAEKQDNGG